MTNYEFYKDEMIKLLASGYKFAVKQDKPIECGRTECRSCDLRTMDASCTDARWKWLTAEHIEPPKLTKAERAFCESLKYTQFYVARDESGKLYVYESKPTKRSDYWSNTNNCHYFVINSRLFNVSFDFIKWGDSEPWKVEDLLELEVIDDE